MAPEKRLCCDAWRELQPRMKGKFILTMKLFTRARLDLRLRMHFMPDFPILFVRHSVLRNIAIVMRLFGADTPGSEKVVLELLREFDLLPLALRPVGTLSHGQAYKAGLIAMLAIDRDLWLLDEPFASGMDPHGIDALKRHARTAAARGKIIIYTTQLLDVAERFSDCVCLIHKGEVRAFERLDQLREAVWRHA